MLIAMVIFAMLLGSPPAVAAPIEWHCTYTKVCFGEEQRCEKVKNFELRFITDTIEHETVTIGNMGTSDVLTWPGSNGVTFIEHLETGAIQTTTISKTGQSVHSRHTLMLGNLVPSQYYGTCRPRALASGRTKSDRYEGFLRGGIAGAEAAENRSVTREGPEQVWKAERSGRLIFERPKE
jgi:hypothetical protein